MSDAGTQEQPPSTRKQNLDRFIELEAPLKLQPDQNFYEQPPFSTITNDVSNESGLTVDQVKRLLTRCTKSGFDRLSKAATVSSQELAVQMQNPNNPNIKKTLTLSAPGERDKYRQAITLLGSALSQYPQWHEYIGSQMENYNTDGSPKGAIYVTAESYGKWTSDKLARNQHLRIKGIEDVFPQDFATESDLLKQPFGPGETKGARRWKILKASELVTK